MLFHYKTSIFSMCKTYEKHVFLHNFNYFSFVVILKNKKIQDFQRDARLSFGLLDFWIFGLWPVQISTAKF